MLDIVRVCVCVGDAVLQPLAYKIIKYGDINRDALKQYLVLQHEEVRLLLLLEVAAVLQHCRVLYAAAKSTHTHTHSQIYNTTVLTYTNTHIHITQHTQRVAYAGQVTEELLVLRERGGRSTLQRCDPIIQGLLRRTG